MLCSSSFLRKHITNATVVAHIYLNLPGSTFGASTFKGGDVRDESQSFISLGVIIR